jgi:RNA polymerase sigma factor (sigma-70 family)
MSTSLEHELQLHARALRGLARVLVGDQHADDLVQDATVQALQQLEPPRSLPAWLAGVLRRLAGKQRRAERRRRAREERAARPEAEPPADREPELADSLRRLTDAVLALPQPYREVVLLRWLRELPPPAIAARLGAPLATVKSRLQRGLALLRARLDADGRGDWRGALCGAFGIERLPWTAAAGTGALAMGTLAKVACAALAIAACVVGVVGVHAWTRAPLPLGEAALASRPSAMPGAVDAGTADGASPVRELVAPAAPAPGAAADPSFDAAMQQLRALAEVPLHAELLRWFARDRAFAERLARRCLEERLAANLKWPAVGAVLAAWLDAGGAPEVVLQSALGCLETVDENLRSRACLGLGWALGVRLAQGMGVSFGLGPGSEQTQAALLDALLRVADARDLPLATGQVLAMALQQGPVGDQRVARALVALARDERHEVRESAIVALGGIVSPEELLAVFGATPTVAVDEAEWFDRSSLLAALQNASSRAPDRHALREWVRAQLSLPDPTEVQTRIDRDIVQQLSRDEHLSHDARALQPVLRTLAGRTSSASLRSEIESLLDKNR